MRFFYLDTGLRDDVGHHANYCRYIVGELRARGVETLVFGHNTVGSALQSVQALDRFDHCATLAHVAALH